MTDSFAIKTSDWLEDHKEEFEFDEKQFEEFKRNLVLNSQQNIVLLMMLLNLL